MSGSSIDWENEKRWDLRTNELLPYNEWATRMHEYTARCLSGYVEPKKSFFEKIKQKIRK